LKIAELHYALHFTEEQMIFALNDGTSSNLIAKSEKPMRSDMGFVNL